MVAAQFGVDAPVVARELGEDPSDPLGVAGRGQLGGSQ